MHQFRTSDRCSEVVTAKLRPEHRAHLERQALARDVSICAIIRDLIDSDMHKLAMKNVS